MAIIDRGSAYNTQRFLKYIEFKGMMQRSGNDMWDYPTYCARWDGDIDFHTGRFVSCKVYHPEGGSK